MPTDLHQSRYAMHHFMGPYRLDGGTKLADYTRRQRTERAREREREIFVRAIH